ncbi:MAG: transcription termination/antitermination protein NusA [Oligoflexia bacterium]|nr:transcription termination/antitermination protein NusA [Oligoflexia bacterium]MBF0366253.1 transcription termination/antitermination protein NusA [Oligoflexia bacterium]
MSFRELGRIIDQLVKDRGIRREVIISAIEQAFLVTAKRKFGIQGEYEAKYNERDDDIEIFQYKNVVTNVKDPILEISLEEAKTLDENSEIGDQLGLKIENPGFTRVDVQTVKQIILQKVRDAEREILFKEFKHREGELVTGIVRRQERGNYIIDLGKAEAILGKRETIPGEDFKPGDRVQAYLAEVIMTNRGPEICLSRTSPMFLVKLFEIEVPEIPEGTIEIKSAAREPGHRAKIAVYTQDKEVDPVGACVGMRGSRVQNIVNELQGEKIDIVKWSPDIETFVRSALAPAEITSIIEGNEVNTMDVIVEDNQLSLAIGKRGQNVRLAAILTGRKVNIISKSKLQEKIKRGLENLVQLNSVSESTAQMLINNGYMCIDELRSISIPELTKMTGVDADAAARILDEVNVVSREGTLKTNIDSEEDIISASAVPARQGSVQSNKASGMEEKSSSDKFSEAEKRLREELAAFKLK